VSLFNEFNGHAGVQHSALVSLSETRAPDRQETCLSRAHAARHGQATAACKQADLCVCLGTSLRIRPASELPVLTFKGLGKVLTVQEFTVSADRCGGAVLAVCGHERLVVVCLQGPPVVVCDFLGRVVPTVP
jgi:hypothetical protein